MSVWDKVYESVVKERSDFRQALKEEREKVQRLETAHNRQQKHIDKLKALLLLTDPAVSNVEMNKLSAAQFDAYERWCQTET